jgi:hypothetical protein
MRTSLEKNRDSARKKPASIPFKHPMDVEIYS